MNGTNSILSSLIFLSLIPNLSLARTTMLRPSGVSSTNDESWAASANSFSDAPSTGINSQAWRLPRVIVPVLSNINISTSPAASMARPLIAKTLAWFKRLIPAIPIAESNAPIVVGAKHTSNATKEVTEIGFTFPAWLAEKIEYEYNETVTNKNIIVNATNKICNAISLGVFLREAPSTIAIILSRKLSPASLVISITNQSEVTVVPPVTALLSPPLSLITGADSPVIALSSTDAAPSITSPSAGICSPAFTITISPFLSNADETFIISSFLSTEGILWASTSFLLALSASACALPRPSAIASAKFANNTVSHRIIVIPSIKPGFASLIPTSETTYKIVVNIDEMYTRNITGFSIWVLGDNFIKESLMALIIIFLSAKLLLFSFIFVTSFNLTFERIQQ